MLANLASQVAALSSKPGASSPGVPGVTAAVVTPKYTTSSQPKPLKSGFFDAPKKRPQRDKVCQQPLLNLPVANNMPQGYAQTQGGNASTIPHIKAKQCPAVPSSFVIPPSEQERQYAAMRKKLTGKADLPGLTV